MTAKPKAKRKTIAERLGQAHDEGYAKGYAVAKRTYLLKASDAINEVVNHSYFKHLRILEGWARELGQPLHSAVPGLDVKPTNQPNQ